MKQLIIIGSAYSLQKGIKKGLWNKISGHLTCGINWSYRYFDSTYLCCLNYVDFYDTNRKDLKKLSLIITVDRPHPSVWLKNTLLLKENYALSGILALSVATRILNKSDEIFLLGFDYGAQRKKTHFYQGEIEHGGVGKSQYYNYPGHAKRDFKQFKNSKAMIYNVSMKSRISSKIFPKISYSQFFKMLDNRTYNQDKLRADIKDKLK